MFTFYEVSSSLRLLSRQLRRARSFAVAAVLTIALSIGVNVVAFGTLDALLLRGLPVPQAKQLFFVQHPQAKEVSLSFPQYLDLRERNRTFIEMGAYDLAPVGIMLHGQAEQRWATLATGSYFDLLGIRPYLGRFPTAADDAKGINNSPFAVLSYDTWKRDFDGDPNVIGRKVTLSKHLFTVLGVAPSGFYGTERFIQPTLWVDLWNAPQIVGEGMMNSRAAQWIWVIGRKKPGVTVAQAQADINRIGTQLGHEFPKTDEKATFTLAEPGYVGNYFGPALHAFLFGVVVMAGLVLAAACANLGGLYEARAADRRQEIAIRLALGSTRRRVAAGLMLESVSLALAGGALGCLLAEAVLKALTRYRPPFDFPIAVVVDPGPRVFLFAFTLSLLAGVMCGLLPMREAWRPDIQSVIKSGTLPAPERRWAARDVLLLVEVTLCCLLVTASAAALRGLLASSAVPLGFVPRGVSIVAYDPDIAGYLRKDALTLDRSLLAAATQIPGVSDVAITNNTPLNPIGQNNIAIYRDGTADLRPDNQAFSVITFAVSPKYFETAGTKLLQGREFSWTDNEKAPAVAIVNETFAKKLFGRQQVLGDTFLDRNGKRSTIVGLVEDGKYGSLNEAPQPVIFLPLAQDFNSFRKLLVRTTFPGDGDSLRITNAAVAILHRQDSSIPISSANSWQTALAPVLFPVRAAAVALSTMGLLALMLAVTGIFGLASYTVARRLREIGIRIALGAKGSHVLRAMLGRVLGMVAAGCALGLALGFASSRLLVSIVYGASASDPLVLLTAAFTMLLMACAATAMPARRALSVEPAMLLHDD